MLEGLAKFAHLINIEFFQDILSILKRIAHDQSKSYVESGTGLLRDSLHCLIAAFQLLTGQGEALNIDLKEFCDGLYAGIPRLVTDKTPPNLALLPMPMSEILDVTKTIWDDVDQPADTTVHAKRKHDRTEMELVLLGFELLFMRRKQMPLDRVASFMKRLVMVSLQLEVNEMLACLAMVRALLVKYPKLCHLLDPEARVGTGVYLPFLDDPDLTNVWASTLWELSVLLNHYHPTVRDYAKHILNVFTPTAANNSSALVQYATTLSTPLPSHLNFSTQAMLTRFNSFSRFVKNQNQELVDTFRFVPEISVSNKVAVNLRKRRDSSSNTNPDKLYAMEGIQYGDKSDFVEKLELKATAEGSSLDDVVAQQKLFGKFFMETKHQRELDALVKEESMWREKVEVMRAAVEEGEGSDEEDA